MSFWCRWHGYTTECIPTRYLFVQATDYLAIGVHELSSNAETCSHLSLQRRAYLIGFIHRNDKYALSSWQVEFVIAVKYRFDVNDTVIQPTRCLCVQATDYLAIGVHELSSISERRIERLVNPG